MGQGILEGGAYGNLDVRRDYRFNGRSGGGKLGKRCRNLRVKRTSVGEEISVFAHNK